MRTHRYITYFQPFLLYIKKNLVSGSESGGDLGVKHEDKGGSDGTESVGSRSLEEGGGTLVLDDLSEAVHGVLVDPLGLRLLGLHLQTTTDGIHGV